MGFERGAIADLLRDPASLGEALRAWWETRGNGRGSQGAYLRWRRFTAYGDEAATFGAHDLLDYLEWRRDMRAIRRSELP